MRKKKEENLNNKKSILKELLSKIIFNKVVLIDNQVVRGLDLERGIYKEQLSNNFINIDLLIYNDKKEFIYSDCFINIVNNNSIKKSFKASKFNKKSFNFISLIYLPPIASSWYYLIGNLLLFWFLPDNKNTLPKALQT